MTEMLRKHLIFAFGVLFFLGLVPFVAQAEGDVVAVRIGAHLDKTRFVLEFSEAPTYRVLTLQDPYRVVIDLPELDWRLDRDQTPASGGLISDWRFGLFYTGSSRVVLDLTQATTLSQVELLPPRDGFQHRLVIDLSPIAAADFQAADLSGGPQVIGPAPTAVVPPEPGAEPSSPEAVPPPEGPAATPVVPASPPPAGYDATIVAGLVIPGRKPPVPEYLLAPPEDLPLVVIDAGHGGPDPGAIGGAGTREKDIVLDYAEALRDALLASGRYRVSLTRDTDVLIPLRDRYRVAQDQNAQLFISLHANVHSSSSLHGASVYTLSEEASDAAAAALAEAENAVDEDWGLDIDADEDVIPILRDLMVRETLNDSKLFANYLVEEVGTVASLLRNTHRFAGFAVLKSPQVPSVLFEIGYLSNAEEERLLNSRSHRDLIVGAAMHAIDRFFANLQALQRS